MKLVYLFLIAQAMCVANAVAGTILNVMTVTYANGLSITWIAYVYAIMLCCFVYKGNRARYGWRKFLLAVFTGFIDCVFNVCNVYAYNYTDFASIILLVSTVVPFAMIFSAAILRARYTYSQVLMCLTIILYSVIFTLIDSSNFFQGRNKLYGDLLAIASAIGYGLNSTLIEKFSAGMTPMAYLCREAVGGGVLSVVLMLAFELRAFRETAWQNFALGVPYAALFVVYLFVAIFLTQHISAVANNLSSLCTNIYTFLIAIFVLRTAYLWLQVVPVAGVLVTTAVYYVSLSDLAKRRGPPARADIADLALPQ